MSEERLVIPRKPRHHRYRFVAALALCGLAVAGVWGAQMKMTFDRYAAERAAQSKDGTQALSEVGERLQLDESAAEIQASVDEIQGMIEDIARQEMAKEQVLDAVKSQIGETVAPAGLPLSGEGSEGVVAGETTEVPVAN